MDEDTEPLRDDDDDDDDDDVFWAMLASFHKKSLLLLPVCIPFVQAPTIPRPAGFPSGRTC